jgi:restriction endonuclease S subunit
MALVVSNITKPTVISINLFIIRPKKDIVPEYLACLLEQAGVMSQIEHISGTSASIKAISAKKLADCEEYQSFL